MKASPIICFCFFFASARSQPALPETDRIRVAEVFRISRELGETIWTGWNEPPFPVLLVTRDYEFLIRHPRPAKDFLPLGYDSLLQSRVFYRERVFEPTLLATFPAVGGISTIVIGQAENTEAKTSTRWVITMMHERFHQLQYNQPDYTLNVGRLDLSGGDQSGMWMLNFPFPYDSVKVSRQFNLLARKLRETLLTESPIFTFELNRFLIQRREFRQMLTQSAYRYLSFQLWQEGVARYTEIVMAELAGRQYEPSLAFQLLDDYVSFSVEAQTLRRAMLLRLRTMSLKDTRRESFYAFGAAEAMLLDRVNPDWKKMYFSDPFFLERHFVKD
jgi:hypothetical protein